MVFTLNHLYFKNILSVGNNVQKFSFQKGLHSITGQNGNGKSVILDALSFCLYGQSYRKINLEELLNNINRAELYTELHFSINSDNYILKRGIKPNILSISCNGQEKELLSSKKLIQEKLNEIIGCDYTIFKQLIALSVSNSKSFFDMSAEEKRFFIENIFNIRILSEMNKKVKTNNSLLKTDLSISEKNLNNIKVSIANIKSSIDQMNIQIANYEQDKKKELKTLKEEIKNLDKHDDNLINQINEQVQKLNLFKNDDISEKDKLLENLSMTNQEIAIINNEINRLTREINIFGKDRVCPTCKKPADMDILINFEKDIEENKIKLVPLTLNKVDYTEKINQLQKKINEKQQIQTEISKLNDKKQYNKNLINNKIDEYEKTKNKQLTINTESLETNHRDLKKQQETEENNILTINQEIKNNNTIINILSDEGFKTYFYSNVIPLLNQTIKSIFQKFKIQDLIKLEIDQYLDIQLSNGKELRKFNSFSEGEKKRIDVIIKLSLFEVCKSLSNWSCNVCIWDELGDSGVDEEGMDSILKALRSNMDQDSSFYLISHKLTENHMNYFDNIIKVERRGNFSDYV